jgi:propanol-preferring alcohol dehydrogenase
MDGGFAEFVLVPHRRHCVPLGDLDPVAAAPLGDAALSPYAVIKRVQPFLRAGSSVVVIGAGGLGQYGVQFARLLTGARVVAVDPSDSHRELALGLGADHALAPASDAAAAILELTGGGAEAVVDFVGTDETLALAAAVVARRGIVALLGLAGGSFRFDFWGFSPEAVLTTVHAGTVHDLHEVVALARTGRLRSRVSTYPLEQVNAALDDLRAGRVAGRAVVTPHESERRELP